MEFNPNRDFSTRIIVEINPFSPRRKGNELICYVPGPQGDIVPILFIKEFEYEVTVIMQENLLQTILAPNFEGRLFDHFKRQTRKLEAANQTR